MRTIIYPITVQLFLRFIIRELARASLIGTWLSSAVQHGLSAHTSDPHPAVVTPPKQGTFAERSFSRTTTTLPKT